MTVLAITAITMTANTESTDEAAGEPLLVGDSVFVLNNAYYKTDATDPAKVASKGIVVTPAASIGIKFTLARSGDLVITGDAMVPNTTYGPSATPGAVEPLTDLTTGQNVASVFVAKDVGVANLAVKNLNYASV